MRPRTAFSILLITFGLTTHKPGTLAALEGIQMGKRVIAFTSIKSGRVNG